MGLLTDVQRAGLVPEPPEDTTPPAYRALDYDVWRWGENHGTSDPKGEPVHFLHCGWNGYNHSTLCEAMVYSTEEPTLYFARKPKDTTCPACLEVLPLYLGHRVKEARDSIEAAEEHLGAVEEELAALWSEVRKREANEGA